MPTKEFVGRMDFIMDVVSSDLKTGKFTFRMTPNPERYELREKNGTKYYYDKFDDVYISLKAIEKAASKMGGKPIYYSPPKTANIDKLFLSRIEEIRSFLNGKNQDYVFQDKSEQFLSKLEKDSIKYVILSIDLKGSTKMSQELNEKDNARIVSLFSREMAIIINNFNGFILKYLGDGLICYFPEPNFVGMNDNAVNCALVMKQFILSCLNPLLKKYRGV